MDPVFYVDNISSKGYESLLQREPVTFILLCYLHRLSSRKNGNPPSKRAYRKSTFVIYSSYNVLK
jgi:hypothetical protein